MEIKIPSRGAILGLATLALTAATVPAQAGLLLFTGADDAAGSLANAPNSVAAAASFDAGVAGLGIEYTITFEGSSLGAFSSLSLGSGISLTGANVNSNDQSIVNTTSDINITPPCSNATCGYNTTSGGSKFLLLFTEGSEAFGVYLTGVLMRRRKALPL